MRLREYIELQAKNNKQLNEWSRGRRFVTDDGKVVKSYSMTAKDVADNFSIDKLELYKIYDIWKKSTVANSWTPEEFNIYFKNRYHNYTFGLFNYVEYELQSIQADFEKSRSKTELADIIKSTIKTILEKNSEDVLIDGRYSGDNAVYLFYHPVKNRIICWELDYGEKKIREVSLSYLTDNGALLHIGPCSLKNCLETVKSWGWR